MATTKVDVNLISATGTPASGNFLRGDGTWNAAGLTLATEQATTSGTDVTFSSIPAGTKMIFIMWEALSYTANSINTKVEIGDSGGIETSGYESNSRDTLNGDNLDATDAFSFKRTSDVAAQEVSVPSKDSVALLPS